MSSGIDLSAITDQFFVADVLSGVMAVGIVVGTIYAALLAVGIAVRLIRGG